MMQSTNCYVEQFVGLWTSQTYRRKQLASKNHEHNARVFTSTECQNGDTSSCNSISWFSLSSSPLTLPPFVRFSLPFPVFPSLSLSLHPSSPPLLPALPYPTLSSLPYHPVPPFPCVLPLPSPLSTQTILTVFKCSTKESSS